MSYGSSFRRFAVVLGCGDIGSAVALALHRRGCAAALVDEATPGDILVEVDLVRAEHECYGVTPAALATATRVVNAIEDGAHASRCCNTEQPEFMDSVVHEEYPRCAST